jgi:glycine dehydrogenase subunit 1
MPFIPHTEQDVREMLDAIGVDSIDALFDEIPPALRARALERVPPGMTEMEIGRLMRERAGQDAQPVSFIGAGAYEHHIPAAVWQITTRGEFYSAYTPYQAEASQGTLQVLYEYQTMMASLNGLDVSNASLYDGATALAEAILMAVRANRKCNSKRVLLPRTVHPLYRQVAQTVVRNQGIELIELDYDRKTGIVDPASLAPYGGQDIAALVIPQPNFFGCLEDVDALTDWAAANGAISVAVVNPTCLALIVPPGQWGGSGVDIACGEGQPLGIPLSSGGPYFGFMCCKQQHVRQMPGRIIGRTLDLDGREGFTLTLQAREQHIRRSKATSNICTNQGLMVTAATIYMALMGPEGLERVAATSAANTRRLVEALSTIAGVRVLFDRPYFHEVVLALPRPAAELLPRLAEAGTLGGLDLHEHYPELGPALLVCATETKTEQDLQRYQEGLTAALAA